MAAFVLLGPPSIRGARTPPLTTDGDADAEALRFLDLLDAGFNDTPDPANAEPRLARTENNSATYANSGNACLDFFFQIVPDTAPERVHSLLSAVWARDPLTELKLVCSLRGVRGTGKSYREGFYASALWVHAHHPRTLACNVPALAEFGYLKDFPELLYRLVHGADSSKAAKEKASARKKMRKAKEARRAKMAAGRKRR
jgi:hypothetical protein